MSLYDGLDIDKSDSANGTAAPDVAGWSSSYKMLQSQLQAKKASNIPSKKPRTGGRLAPVVDLKKTIETDYGLHFDHLTGKLQRTKTQEKPHNDKPQALPFISTGPGPSITGAVDEYDPLHPNEYEEIMRIRREEKDRVVEEERRKQAEEDRLKRNERERERMMRDDGDRRGRDRLGDSDMETSRRRREESEEEEFGWSNKKSGTGSGGGAAIAPPQALIDDDSASNNNSQPDVPPPAGGSIASKIMAKYGYRQGQGLGKSEQGMSIALQIEKTSKRGGKIIHERDIIKANTEAQAQQAQSNTNLLKNPSKVLLLLNMVGPGEVDDELEPETADECSKYGKVTKCVVLEVPDSPEDVAVRIFVEFERMEAAIKALVDLNGRYFGGRTVKACFYNLDKFRRMDYLDEIE